MGINPDREHEAYRHGVPSGGDLRFVEKEVDNHGTPALRRILQRYEYSYADGKWDWYDVQLVET